MSSRAPSRGVLAGIKADAQRAKETGDTYNPNGVGAAWSHNFLNQKPWHPLSFRNQKARFEAEERAFKEAKTNQQAQREFEEEQNRLMNSSFLNEADRKRYSDLQSVSFMYSKPPGLEAALQREKPKEGDAEGAGPSSSTKQPGGAPGSDPQRPARPVPRIDAASFLSAKEALAAQQRLDLKHTGYRSPTRGGIDDAAENQQLVVGLSSSEGDSGGDSPPPRGADDEADARPGGVPEEELASVFSTFRSTQDLEGMVAGLPDKQRKKILRAYAKWKLAVEEAQMDNARAYLEAAGYTGHSKGTKRKGSKKEKKRRHKEKRSKRSHGDR